MEVVEPLLEEAQWKCAMRDSGGQYVTTCGGPMMPKWHADSLDSLLMVFYIAISQSRERTFTVMYISVIQEQLLIPVVTLDKELDAYCWMMWHALEENQDC